MSTKRLVIGAILGAVVGAIDAAYMILYGAPAAVAVRPDLAHVGFWTALFANHGGDWLFYHEPVLATAATVILTATVGAILLAVAGWR